MLAGFLPEPLALGGAFALGSNAARDDCVHENLSIAEQVTGRRNIAQLSKEVGKGIFFWLHPLAQSGFC